MKRSLFALLVLLGAPMFAQPRVPDLPFESVPDFFKLPPGMNFGEVSGVAVNSKGHVFVFTRSNSAHGPAYAPAAAQLLEFGPKGEFVREIGKGLYGWSFAHTVRIDKDDNIWAVDKGSDMVIKFNPGRPRDAGVRTPEGIGGRGDQAVGARRSAAAARGRPVPPADRCRLGLGRQHLHQRRLRQLPRREVRQERRLGEVVGRARHAARAVQPAARDRHRPQQQRSTSAIDRTGASRCSTPTASFCGCSPSTCLPLRAPVPVNGNTPTGERLAAVIGAPNSICITPGPNQVMFVGESTFPGPAVQGVARRAKCSA